MDLHSQIMNMNCDPPVNMEAEPNQRLAYKTGHRDARHEAAELALSVDVEAIAWAYGKCVALGLENGSMESAMMMDRLKLMLS